MESSFQNSVSDFDLNFLNNVPGKILVFNPKEKKSAVAHLKKKVVLTDYVLRKYDFEKKRLAEVEKLLMESRDESRNISIEKQNLLQNCNILENEIQKLKIENKQLQDRGFLVETEREALKSHINQLQVLVGDYETQIESFKIEAKLHKDTTLSHVRKINNQKKENDTLIKHISILRDVIKKKKKVNKTVQNVLDKYNNLDKYPESEPESVADSSSEHFEDATTTFFSEDSYDTNVIPQQAQETTKTTENKFKSIADEDTNIKSNNSTESENNDVRSVDTGRGSSLAFSDGGKSFHSPDYYMADSPLGSVITSSKNLKSYKDGATSPMLINKQCRSVSTSPIPTQKACHDRGTSPVTIHRRSVATSPVIFEINRDKVNTIDRGASPIKILECFKLKNKNVYECRDVAVDTTSLVCNITTPPRTSAPRERECLERNNSLTINEDRQSDSEIQLILGEMKLHKRLTPIPSTPLKSSSARSYTVSNLSTIEESLFDKFGPETIVHTKTLADMFNMVVNEAIPHLVNGQVDVRKQQGNTCDCRRASDAYVLNNTSESRQNDSLNITEVYSELEEQNNRTSDLTENNYTATVSDYTQNNSSNTNEENSDSEFKNQQISDSDFVNSMSYLESKTGNDNNLEQVPSQQTKTIDSEHCIELEEQEIDDSDFVNSMGHLESSNDNQLEQVLSQETKTIDSEHCIELEEQEIDDSDFVNSMSHLEFKTGNENQLEQLPSQQKKCNDREHCVAFEEQQISDSDFVNSMSHIESKTGNDNQLEQLPGQQKKCKDREHCVAFEEQQISDSDFDNSMSYLESKTGNDNQLEHLPSQQKISKDREHCVAFEGQQISDSDFDNSMSHFESKTGNNILQEQVPSLQTKTIDHADANESKLQMKDPNYNVTEFRKKLKYQEEVVDKFNRTIVLSKTRKKKKLTNLEKIRNRLAPKSKIMKSAPVRKVCVKPKQLRENTLLSTKIRDSDTSASLNDKQVYEKAVKVMTELKAKQCERKRLTVIVEDCLKVKDKYASRRSSEVNNQNTVLDTILKSQAQILKPAAKSTDNCLKVKDKHASRRSSEVNNQNTVLDTILKSQAQILKPAAKSTDDCLKVKDKHASRRSSEVNNQNTVLDTILKSQAQILKPAAKSTDDCLKVKDKYASRRSSEVNNQNTVLDTILKSQAQILKPAAKSTDDCLNLSNSVNTTSTELKRRTKRNSSDAPTEVIQTTRTLRPRRQSKTNDSLSDGSNSCNENKKSPELNSVESTVADLIHNVEIANKKIEKRIRIRTRRYDSTDSEGNKYKASPAKSRYNSTDSEGKKYKASPAKSRYNSTDSEGKKYKASPAKSRYNSTDSERKKCNASPAKSRYNSTDSEGKKYKGSPAKSRYNSTDSEGKKYTASPAKSRYNSTDSEGKKYKGSPAKSRYNSTDSEGKKYKASPAKSRYDSSDSEGKKYKASPAKIITVIEEQNYVPATINKRILRSSLRQENDDETNNVSSQSNSGNSGDDGEALLNDYYTVPNKRSRRTSRCDTTTRKSSTDTKLIINRDKTKLDNMIKDNLSASTKKETKVNKVSDKHTKPTAISYSDLDLFSTEPEDTQPPPIGMTSMEPVIQSEEGVLCLMIQKHGDESVRFYAKKPLESVTEQIHQKLEKQIEKINASRYNETQMEMIKLIMEIRYWDIKDFIVGLMKYLKDPNRKTELFSAIIAPPAPPATKSEQVLLYIIADLRYNWAKVDLVCDILKNIEFHLFSLNRTPDFNIIESMSHFYAMLCRHYDMQSRVRLFILDALYCIQFKAIPLIKQCLDVWMHILPLAHLSTAQTPLVTCLVYLLHFYKCEDKFNRIHGLRMVLKRKYFYDVNAWNEPKILEFIRTTINGLGVIPIERKMLRLALLIISKRQGPRWCLKNIVIGILQPMIEKNNTSNRVKLFCISMLGALLRPFPNDMRVHCEVVVNKLMDMLDQPQSQEILEAIYSSLIYLSKHNEMRLHTYLLKWKPQNVSHDFEGVLKSYVKTKSIRVWKNALKNCRSSY